MVESTDVDVHMEQMGGKRALSPMLFVRVRCSYAICAFSSSSSQSLQNFTD